MGVRRGSRSLKEKNAMSRESLFERMDEVREATLDFAASLAQLPAKTGNQDAHPKSQLTSDSVSKELIFGRPR